MVEQGLNSHLDLERKFAIRPVRCRPSFNKPVPSRGLILKRIEVPRAKGRLHASQYRIL